MYNHLKATIVGIALFAPALAFAQDLTGVLSTLNVLVGAATPIVVALALVYFFWGLGNFILNSGNEEKRKSAIEIMIYGIIALFVMVSIWGIVNVLQSTFLQGASNGPIQVPKVQGINGQ